MRFGKQVSHGGPKRSREEKRRPKQQGPRYLLETSENDEGDEACDENRSAGEAETTTVGLPRRLDLVLARPITAQRQRWASSTTFLFFHSIACPSFY